MTNNQYNLWLNSSHIKESDKDILRKYDEKEITDAFYQELSFGTAGLRGKLGIGTNRMNLYTVGRACTGLANTILNKGEEAKKRGVAISYDIRHMSKEFAELSAQILAANGIKVYLYDDFKTTPLLSYTVLKFNAIAGIMVTASHNPKIYNGYKVYWEDGAQINDEIADEISKEIKNIDEYGVYKTISIEEGIENGLIQYIGETIENEYLNKVIELSLTDDVDKNINVVYTPLNGTGNLPVRHVLDKLKFTNVFVVEEQELPDPDFTTVGYPNPEDPKAFKLAEELALKKNADIILGTDPDCDRVAIGIRNGSNSYEYLTGNKTGILLVDFICNVIDKNTLQNSFMVKSIVTGTLGEKIAKHNGVDFYSTLTGFKNICGKAIDVENDTNKKFLFGYEESIGYLFGRVVRDKDAVVTSMLLVEMIGYYKKRNISILAHLQNIYSKYGHHEDKLIQKVIEGSEGKLKINKIMQELRENPPKEIDGLKVDNKIDYLNDKTGIQKSNVLKFIFNDGSWLAVRPSGTEPKIKFYIEAVSNSKEDSLKIVEDIENYIDNLLK